MFASVFKIFRYIVIKPYGQHLESRHGLRVILIALRDVAQTMKSSNTNNILHCDIKPSNIILHENHGYLIDWDTAKRRDFPEAKELSATIAFCPLAVWLFFFSPVNYMYSILQDSFNLKAPVFQVSDSLTTQKSHEYTIDDDVESLFYTLMDILCDGRLIWTKALTVEDVDVHKRLMIYEFEKQLNYAPEEFHSILSEFHFLFFDSVKRSRKQIDIDTVIEFFDHKIGIM